MSHLSNAQLLTLKAAIAAETDPTFVALRQQGATGAMADWYNGASTIVVWKTRVTIAQIGEAISGTDLGNLTTANHTRLQTAIALFQQLGVNPSRSDSRAMFADIFSSFPTSTASLTALWKRFATKAEKLFISGTGTDASPATMLAEGGISNEEIVLALNAT